MENRKAPSLPLNTYGVRIAKRLPLFFETFMNYDDQFFKSPSKLGIYDLQRVDSREY